MAALNLLITKAMSGDACYKMQQASLFNCLVD